MRRNPDPSNQNLTKLIIAIMALLILYLLLKKKSCHTSIASKCPRHPKTPKCPNHPPTLKCPACPKAPPCPNQSCPISPPCPLTCPAYPSPAPCPEAPATTPMEATPASSMPTTTFGVLGRALDLGYDVPAGD